MCLLRILWYNVIHTTANYQPGLAFVPMNPTKFYNDTRPNATFAHNLPDAAVTAVSVYKLRIQLFSALTLKILPSTELLHI